MKRILVIEDEEPLRLNILMILQSSDYETLEAENGKIGVEIAKQHLPDLIISDIMMPELDGYGVLKELRRHKPTALIPFLFLSAKVHKSDVREGMNLGADDYLSKPFRMAELLEAVATRLKKTEEIRTQSNSSLEALRSNLSYSLPHEFLTPMTSILGCSEILERQFDVLEREDVVRMHHEIATSARRLLHLIQKFLLYARLERISQDGEELTSLRSSVLSSAALHITEIIDAKALAYERRADIQLDLADAAILIAAGEFYILMEELLDNALKFSEPGTLITIHTEQIEGTYCLTITDQGRGMNAEQIADIGAYMQFDRKQYEQQGSGLGLAIARRITDIFDGHLLLRSQPEQGTSITVSLPVVTLS